MPSQSKNWIGPATAIQQARAMGWSRLSPGPMSNVVRFRKGNAQLSVTPTPEYETGIRVRYQRAVGSKILRFNNLASIDDPCVLRLAELGWQKLRQHGKANCCRFYNGSVGSPLITSEKDLKAFLARCEAEETRRLQKERERKTSVKKGKGGAK